jgi:hypothetical protein
MPVDVAAPVVTWTFGDGQAAALVARCGNAQLRLGDVDVVELAGLLAVEMGEGRGERLLHLGLSIPEPVAPVAPAITLAETASSPASGRTPKVSTRRTESSCAMLVKLRRGSSSTRSRGRVRRAAASPPGRLAQDLEAAAVGHRQAEERCLPRPVRADDSVDLADHDVQVHTVQRDYITEALADPARTYCPGTAFNPSSVHRGDFQATNRHVSLCRIASRLTVDV